MSPLSSVQILYAGYFSEIALTNTYIFVVFCGDPFDRSPEGAQLPIFPKVGSRRIPCPRGQLDGKFPL